MSEDHSVSRWLGPIQQGDERAAQELWERYFDKLVRLARDRLAGAKRRTADEEDVALSGFHSFCKEAAAGKFPRLNDRDDLWKLLVTITARKAGAEKRHQRRAKRGGGEVRGESVLGAGAETDADLGLAQIVGAEPTPLFAAQLAEEYQRQLQQLGSELGEIVQLKLEGYTNAEIAERLGRSERSVERKLARIRAEWLAE